MEDKRVEATQVKTDVQKHYQAELIRYQRQIEKSEKNNKVMQPGKSR